ncbi:MAG: porin family protein [Betaproteobacteria bacterium]|nr:porin family protein [Betaproteobacteria bacterium]
MKSLTTALVLAAGLAAAPAFAQSWYFGAGVGVGNLNKSGTDLTGLYNASVDDSDTTYTIRGGYKFSPNIAVELGYYDLGNYSFSGRLAPTSTTEISGSAKAKSWGISVVGIAPIHESFDVYARIGIEQSELKANANSATLTANDSDKQTGATYGVGAHYYFNKQWGLFGEWMKNDKINVDSYLIGADFRF